MSTLVTHSHLIHQNGSDRNTWKVWSLPCCINDWPYRLNLPWWSTASGRWQMLNSKVSDHSDCFTWLCSNLFSTAQSETQVNQSESFTNFAFKQLCDWPCPSIACLALTVKLEDLSSLFCLQNWPFHLSWGIFSTTGLIPHPLLQKLWSLFPLDQRSDDACLIDNQKV